MKLLMPESENVFVNFQWPSKLGFPRKIRVYVVPVAWFSQLNSLFLFLVFFLFLCVLFLFFFLFFKSEKMAKKKVKEKHQCVYPELPSFDAVKSSV